MATKQKASLLQCTGCHKEWNLESKTLPCLHSFCRSCFDKHFGEETYGNGQCPKCHEPFTFDQLSLSPFLVNSLRRLKLESTGLKCDVCWEDGIDSTARNWCHDCQKLYCDNCSAWHNKFPLEFHTLKDLGEMERGEAITALTGDIVCSFHHKPKDLYCDRCNMCLCDTCYQNHSADSPGCSSRPSSVRGEDLKYKLQGSSLAKEIDDLEMCLKGMNEKIMNYTEELNSDCDSKCSQVWESYLEMMENAKRKTNELCENMKQMMTEQVESWRHLLEKNEKILKQLEIWRINLHHLLNQSQQDVNVVCGLRSLRSKLSSWLHKSVGPVRKCQLRVTFSNRWLQSLKQLKSGTIGSVSLTAAKNFVPDKELNLDRSNSIDITSIHVSNEDDHVFISDYNKQSVIEYNAQGKLFCECQLFDGTNRFTPWDMCTVSRDIFVVACGRGKKMIFLERKNPSLLQIKKIIPTNKEFISLCEINGSIFACDDHFHIDSFTKEGEKLKTIMAGESKGGFWPRIRADPSTGNFWRTSLDSSEIICFNPDDGEKLQLVKTGEKITDFCVEKSGHIYLCNYEGLFSFPPKTILYEFEKKSEHHRRIFSLRNNIFVCFRIDGEYFIQMFNEVQPKHNLRESDEMEDAEEKMEIGSSHSADSPRYSSQPLSVGEGALKRKLQSPTLPEEMYNNLHIVEGISGVKEETKKCKTVPSSSKTFPSEKKIIKDKEWFPRGYYLDIYSIHFSEEDQRVFLCNYYNHSIDEYTIAGGFVCRSILSDGPRKFPPFDLCSIAPNMYVVACGLSQKLIYLKRIKKHPSLQIEKMIDTKERFYSLCQINETVFACDPFLKIVSFTKEGEVIKTIKTGESFGHYPLIRADPSIGNLWLTRRGFYDILSFDQNGKKLRSVKTEKEIHHFSVNEFCLIFCDDRGIFSSSSKKYLYKFEKESEFSPTISVSSNKIFVYLGNDRKIFIKIFNIVD